jgi:NitT/TauT family transport system ATP-binding protein
VRAAPQESGVSRPMPAGTMLEENVTGGSMTQKLTVQGITHRYGANGGLDLLVLDDVTFSVATGEFISVIGASGSGKTTLLRIIAGLMKPSSGEVLIDGQRGSKPGKKMSFVFQRDSLWPWRTVIENASYGLDIAGLSKKAAADRARPYIEMVGLRGFEGYYPHQISGGMRQRVNLARALAVEPDILLMDEPFAALDAQTREIMQLELTRIWEKTKKTVVLVTHQIDEAVFLADRVVTMSARPGAVRAITPITLDRPRGLRAKRTEAFQAYVSDHWDMIEKEVLNDFQPRLPAQ